VHWWSRLHFTASAVHRSPAVNCSDAQSSSHLAGGSSAGSKLSLSVEQFWTLNRILSNMHCLLLVNRSQGVHTSRSLQADITSHCVSSNSCPSHLGTWPLRSWQVLTVLARCARVRMGLFCRPHHGIRVTSCVHQEHSALSVCCISCAAQQERGRSHEASALWNAHTKYSVIDMCSVKAGAVTCNQPLGPLVVHERNAVGPTWRASLTTSIR
jgi:hypothetical protein